MLHIFFFFKHNNTDRNFDHGTSFKGRALSRVATVCMSRLLTISAMEAMLLKGSGQVYPELHCPLFRRPTARAVR